jgi:hypothetical protein
MLTQTNPRHFSDAKKLSEEASEMLERVERGEATIPQAKRELGWSKPEKPLLRLVYDLEKLGKRRAVRPPVLPVQANLRDIIVFFRLVGGYLHPSATAGGVDAAGLARDDHVRLEASEFQPVEGGGAHVQRGA